MSKILGLFLYDLLLLYIKNVVLEIGWIFKLVVRILIYVLLILSGFIILNIGINFKIRFFDNM